MKNFFYILFIFSICYKSADAQILFEKNYTVSGDISTCTSVITTSDGGYAACGYTFTPTQIGDYFLKTDSKGNSSFNGYINMPDGTANTILQVSGGYLLGGNATVGSVTGASITKIDGSGNISWTKFMGNMAGNVTSMEPTTDGGFIVGISAIVGSSPVGAVAKINSTGDTLWTIMLSNQYVYTVNSVKQTSDGGFILTGAAELSPSDGAYLVKMTSAGKISWMAQYPYYYNSAGNSVIQTADGGYAIAGTMFQGSGHTNIEVVKTDSKGDTTWTKQIGNLSSEAAMTILQTKDGGYVLGSIVPGTHAGNTIPHPALMKITSTGNVKWIRTYGTNWYNSFADMKATSDGGYILAVNCSDSIHQSDLQATLIKTDSSGLSGINEQGEKSFSTLSVFPNPAHSIATFQINGFLVGSSYNFTLYNLQGNIINSISNIKSNRFDANVSGLPRGIYIYKFVDENGGFSNGKIEIE